MILFGSLVFALALAEVTPWTIDLPEARKFLFEKNDRLEKERHEPKQYYKTEINDQVLLSNRYDSNSKHHEKPHDHDSYAKDYEYHSYMEKEVRGIVYDGSEYLEGLQRSIERFTDLLENCTRMNMTNQRYFFNETAFNATSFNSTSYNFTSSNTTSEPWRPNNERVYNETTYNSTTELCRNVTRASEHVRRLAALATKATKELQDIAYSRKYMKEDPYDLSKEENELILKLAWFLDRLAYYTGYKPQSERLSKDYYTTTTAAPPVMNVLNASEDTKVKMMNCLKQDSDVPATIRCAYPQEIPGVVQFMINNSNPMPGGLPSSSNRNERVVPLQPATSEQELLIATAYHPVYQPYHHLTAVTHVKKRSLTNNELSMSKSKRAAEDPAILFMKYFVKHKVWENSNPTRANPGFKLYEVSNAISERAKRDVSLQEAKRATKNLKLPENPYQDISGYVKSKKGVNYVKDENQAEKIRKFIEKINNSKSSPKERSRRIAKLFRNKRSYTYETDVDKPRNPDDLFEDISYYIKNKPGTNFNRDFVQAAQVRAGLEQIFLNPNIETVRRYGANFNPLVPDPLMFGTLRSAADN